VRLFSLLLAACGPAAVPPAAPAIANTTPTAATPPHELVATLERQACYGWCPIYKIAIYRDGAVEYHGEEFVKVRGDAKGHVTDAQLADLDRFFAEAQYFTLADSYEHEDVTDNPYAITSYHQGARSKEIKHYYGDDHAPTSLTSLESQIDHLVSIEQWIGTEDEREKHAREWH
jgi:hypothetical protein